MTDSVNIETRKKILSAAEEVFSEFGFHKTLVEEIANRAQVGKGTIYRYFENKIELFKSLMYENNEELEVSVLKETERCDDVIEKFKVAVKAYLEFFKMHRKLFYIMIFEHEGVSCKNNDECWEKHLSYAKIIEKILAKGIDEGAFKRIDIALLSHSILGILNHVVIKWMRSKDEYDIIDESEAIFEIIFSGIRTQNR